MSDLLVAGTLGAFINTNRGAPHRDDMPHSRDWTTIIAVVSIAFSAGASVAATKGHPASSQPPTTTTDGRPSLDDCVNDLTARRKRVYIQAFQSVEAMSAANEDFRKAYSEAAGACQEKANELGDPDFTQWAGTLIALAGYMDSLAAQTEQTSGYLELNRLLASATRALDQARDAYSRIGQEKVTPDCNYKYDEHWNVASDATKIDQFNPMNLFCRIQVDWNKINQRKETQQAPLQSDVCEDLFGMVKDVMAVETTTVDSVGSKYRAAYEKAPKECRTAMGDVDQLLSTGIIVGIGRQLQKIAVFVDRASDEKALTAYADTARKGIVLVEQAYVNLKSNAKEPETPSCPVGPSGNPYDPINHYCDAEKAAGHIAYQSRLRISATKSLCGGIEADGTLRHFCFSYGFISSNLSQIWLLRSRPEGLEGGRLVSIAVPYAGMRWIPSLHVSYLAVDLSVYSAYFTTASIDLSNKATPCTPGMNQLERLLPCEANPPIRPYVAMQLGVTIGRSGIGYVTASPISFGFAQVGNQGMAPYYGMVVSSLQVTGQF